MRPPAEATIETADPLDPIRNATAKELHNIMLALCDVDEVKKRVVIHLRVFRRTEPNAAIIAEADADALINSATEMELRSIGIAMCDGDEGMKKRVSECLRVLSVLGKLQATEIKDKPQFKCLKYQQSYHEEDNTARSCRYHPGKSPLFPQVEERLGSLIAHIGRFENQMDEELPILVSRWSCCGRGAYDIECKIQKHKHK